MSADTGSGEVVRDEAAPSDHQRWRVRPRLSGEDRRAAMDALMIRPTAASLRRFAVLLVLSVVVASVGLLQNSTAVVIGAMMIAPLMAPIMGIAASLVMGWGPRLARGLATVALSVMGAVAVALVMAILLPDSGTALPTEVLARSSPDVRDLLVALAAGAAGAYATVRRDVSGALPGVAVAVALVPPLACVGVLLGRDQPDLARGAGLLFVTNLFGIVLAASVVFVVTGFVPEHRVRFRRRRVLVTLVAAALPALAVGVVLTARFIATAAQARQLAAATRTVVTWLGTGDDELNRVTLNGSTVQVNLSGASAPPRVKTLTDALTSTLGRPMTVDLRWTPTEDGQPAPSSPPVPDLDAIRPVVQQWLDDQSLTLTGLSYDSGALVVSCSGPQPPHATDDLAGMVDSAFGSHPPINLAWTRTDPAATPTAGGTDAAVATARDTAEAWAAEHPGTAVLAVDGNEGGVVVTILGTVPPATADLQVALSAALPQTSVAVQWVSGSVLGRTTPSPPAPAPTGPLPSPSPSG